MGRQFIVRRRNGTLIGWGNSDWGQLGGNFSFARTKDGTLWFWGDESAAPGLLGVRDGLT